MNTGIRQRALVTLFAALIAGCADTPPQPAQPQTQSQPAAAAAQPASTTTASDDPVECEDMETTGSHMLKRVCMTRSEREAEAAAAKSFLDRPLAVGQ
jgi:hypothetical protein